MSDESLNEPTAKPADDESLAGTTVETAFGKVPFNLDQWVQGVLPTRRSVTVYQRPDLLAQIDELAAREAVARREDREALVEQAVALTGHLRASGVQFVIEGRTSSWIIDHDKALTGRGVKDDTDILLHRLAAQIVEPAGVTFEHLKALAEVTEPQVIKLVEAMTAANSSAPQINPRFSRAS